MWKASGGKPEHGDVAAARESVAAARSGEAFGRVWRRRAVRGEAYVREHFERPNAVIAQNVVIAPAVQLSSGQASERGGTARPLVAPKGSCARSLL